MQEIAIILSSLAGVATAAAVRKMPKNKNQLLTIGASTHIKNQVNSLKIEKDILTKTISRLYQSDSEFSKIQRDKLLLKYQHQLGIVLAKLEKLEAASHHPDLGPVGDGLITLMDQKLSKIDDRLYELSSKIQTKKVTPEIEKKEEKQKEKITKEVKKEANIDSFNIQKQKTPPDPIVIPPSKTKQSFELTTLTKFSRKNPKFTPLEHKQLVTPKEEIVNDISKRKPNVADKIETIDSSSTEQEIKKQPEKRQSPLEQKPDLTKEVSKITQHKALPSPKEQKQKPSILVDDFEEDDGDDLDRIKGDIMRVLSKLEQAEVE